MRHFGLRMAAGVLAALGGALALVTALVMVIFGVLLDVITTSTDVSLGLTGFSLLFFGLLACVLSAGFFVLPRPRWTASLLALDIALIVWSLARIDAWVFAVIAVLPLCFAVILGFAAPQGSRLTAETDG
jgi:hypothetical protein